MSKTAKIIFGVVLVVIVALALYFLINSLSRTARGRGLFSVLCAIMLNKHIAEHGSDRVSLHYSPSGSLQGVHLRAWQRLAAHAPVNVLSPYV